MNGIATINNGSIIIIVMPKPIVNIVLNNFD
jgi:hypothetical protein